MPGVCGRVCYHPCEQACNRKDFDQAVNIRGFERYLSDHGRVDLEREVPVRIKKREGCRYRLRPGGPERRLAVGPAGIPGHHLRGPARTRRDAALRHPGVPSAQRGTPTGNRLHPATGGGDPDRGPGGPGRLAQGDKKGLPGPVHSRRGPGGPAPGDRRGGPSRRRGGHYLPAADQPG